MKTTHDIEYKSAPYAKTIAIIPAGTQVVLADNIPSEEPLYWVEPWPGMSDIAESWLRGYGFLLESHEVE